MPAAGLEPARGCPRQILSLMRLPFRHAGVLVQRSYSSTRVGVWQVFFTTIPCQSAQILKPFHRFHRIFPAAESGQTEVVFAVLSKSGSRGADHLDLV